MERLIGDGMRSVQVLLSSYNGEKYIQRQIDSILAQEEVDIHLLIRDDGSKDRTREIIAEYVEKYPDKVEVVTGENLGYKKSFLTLLQLAGDYDYYAFADQDDYWLPDKEISSIREMEKDGDDIPKLAQVNLEATDENLKPLVPPPAYRELCVPEHDNTYAGDFFQGCIMTWNQKAMDLFRDYMPKGNYSHDHWVGKVTYLLGRVYFVTEKKIYYSRHGDNTSTTDDRFGGRYRRLMTLLHGNENVYDNMGADLLAAYRHKLSDHDVRLCEDFVKYKTHFSSKWRLLTNSKLRRPSALATVLYKFCILINRV